jgi:hypothetical protein
MAEVFQRPQDVPIWHDAALGKPVDWEALMSGYGAAVDWPPSAFWEELSAANPSALILLSTRDPESWWESASSTIFKSSKAVAEERPEWFAMITALFKGRFVDSIEDKDACIAAFKRHNAHVLETAPKDRLLVCEAKDGWAPICERLGLPVPEEPFPRANTKEEFIARMESGH